MRDRDREEVAIGDEKKPKIPWSEGRVLAPPKQVVRGEKNIHNSGGQEVEERLRGGRGGG